MLEFLIVSAIALLLLCVSSLILYELLSHIWRLLPRLDLIHHRARLLLVVIAAFFSHVAAIWLYAGTYYLLVRGGRWGNFSGEGILNQSYGTDFLSCLYLSATTYASLGYGDIVPTGSLRMLAGAEVLTGLMLIGCSVTFVFLLMQRYWDEACGPVKK